MRRRTGFVMALTLAAWPAFWGCAGGSPYRDPEWPGYTWGGRSEEQKADPSQVQQQLASLTAQLAADLRARQVQRLAVLPFENTSGANPESLGAYLTEKITNLFYADRVGTVVERTYLKKVIDEIERGYSGPFDPLSLKEIGHLLNADALVLGSYTRLANGTTEVMARAVSVETGEIVGASSAVISGKIVPHGLIVVREPLLATRGTLQAEGTPTTAYPAAYPTPQVVVPSYDSVTNTVVPFYGYTPTWRPGYLFSSVPRFSRPWVMPPSSSRSFGHRSRKR